MAKIYSEQQKKKRYAARKEWGQQNKGNLPLDSGAVMV
jgi:hypothetical protein